MTEYVLTNNNRAGSRTTFNFMECEGQMKVVEHVYIDSYEYYEGEILSEVILSKPDARDLYREKLKEGFVLQKITPLTSLEEQLLPKGLVEDYYEGRVGSKDLAKYL